MHESLPITSDLEKVNVEDHGDGYGVVELKRGKTGYMVFFSGIHCPPIVTKGRTWGSVMEGFEDGPEKDEVLAKAWELFNAETHVQLELTLN